MASKTIMIQEDTYKNLSRLKKKNESFNDLIQRLIFKEQDLHPFFGLFTKSEGDEIEKAIDEARISNDLADLDRGDDF